MRTSRIIGLGLALAFSVYGMTASAGLIFSPSVFYKNYTDEFGAGNKVETTETFYDIKLGYALSNGLYFGGLYSGMTRDQNDVKQSRSSYGASLGYVSGGWFLMGHYLLSSEYKIGSDVTYTGGTGFQADLGHWFRIANQFFIGPQVTYRTWTYSDLKTDSGTQSASGVKGSELLPFISLAVMF